MRRAREKSLAGADTKQDARNISHGPWDDPCRLIESYCRGRCFVEETPETIVIAWSGMLQAGLAPKAARSLFARLRGLSPQENALAAKQNRLRALLKFVAGHQWSPRASLAAPPRSTPEN